MLWTGLDVTVAAFSEHRFELCAVYVCSVSVMTTVDLYLQYMNSKFQCDARQRPFSVIFNGDGEEPFIIGSFSFWLVKYCRVQLKCDGTR
jgi:hypothetical protein